MSNPVPTDLDWLALCLVTESNRPKEWSAIAQVIENRRETGRWGDSYMSVVTAKRQFSAFNGRSATALSFDLMTSHESPIVLMHAAVFVTENEPGAPLSDPSQTWTLVISAATLHYYSPISMKPSGSKPAWASSAKRLYTPPWIDPERFVFAEGVP